MEDSVVNIVSYVERKILQSFVTTVHNTIINGDTDNVINGTTAANSPLRQIDGLRKIAADGSRVIEAGELDLADIREARAKLELKGVNPENLLLILDYQSYNKLLGLTQVETMEKFGNSATVKDGRIVAIDGIRVITRAEVPLTQANGVVSNTPADNVAGNIILVHVPSLYVGFKRALEVQNDYDTTTVQFFFTGSTRFDFAVNEKDAPCVAVITNTVVDSE
jgi:HK97 family phage major capsid protein